MQRENKATTRVIFTTLLLSFIYIGDIISQPKKPYFIGVQPGITVEPFYQDGEFDVNVFPLIFETPISSRINVRISPTINYHVGGTKNGVSDLGVYTVLPVFFKKNDENVKSHGLYIGPVAGFGRNLIDNHYTTTLALEPGYMFPSKKRFTVILGVQFGASYFAYDSQPNKWFSHWGPKVSLGFWLN